MYILVSEYEGGYLFSMDQKKGTLRVSLSTRDEEWIKKYGREFRKIDAVNIIKQEMEW
jgi:hypothetical protein